MNRNLHRALHTTAVGGALLALFATTSLSASAAMPATAVHHHGSAGHAAGTGGRVTAADYAKHPTTAASRKHAAHGKASALQVQAAQKGAARTAVAGLAPAAANTLSSATASAATAPALDPGGEPDYFGNVPNYANSPLPTGGADVSITDATGTEATASATVDGTGAVTGIVVSGGGKGYDATPTVTISGAGTGATAHAVVVGGVTAVTIGNGGGSGYDSTNPPKVTFSAPTVGTDQARGTAMIDQQGTLAGVQIDSAGSGYSSAKPPTVTITSATDPVTGAIVGSGATATTSVSGTVDSIVVDTPGSGYLLSGSGIRKFVDSLPGVGKANPNDLGQYISQAHPDTITFPGADYYEIGLVEVQRQLHKDLPPSTLRLYVQLNLGTDGNGVNTVAPDGPQYMGPMIDATAGRPVRVKFVNMLPKTQGATCDRSVLPKQDGLINGTAYNDTAGCGNLFLPVDTNTMGAGMGPLGMNTGGKPMDYSQNRATIHLHGGKTPWISDGTPHQWITPTGEDTVYPKGVSVSYVPDMWFDANGNPSAAKDLTHTSNAPGDGAETFYYTNQQSARMMFFHDHSYGITRLNVYAGEEAPYIIHDAAEKAFEQATADIADGADTIPLVLQDKTFVPDATQLAAEDPTWQTKAWGGKGNLWLPHVWMTNQNPTNDNGANPMGRWDYGPWFWPPFTGLKHDPVPNHLFNPNCNPASNACENAQNPGFDLTNADGTDGNVSQTMESFFDTMLVNGTAYPTQKVGQKVYRLRILNGSNDRHLNLSLFYAKSNGDMWNKDASGQPTTLKDGNAGEVPMMDATAAAANDPANGCTDAQKATWPHDGRDGGVPACKAAGPDMVQVGNDGGFLPAPATISAQPIDFEYNRRNIIVLDVLHHGLLLAPAERADVLVDFSKVPDGAKLMLYNDAPAADPAIDPRNDYYTGDPDQTDSGGAPTTQPGYGPNTRTVMQFQVDATKGTSNGLDMAKLAGNPKALVSDPMHFGTLAAAYQADQPAPVVPQLAYNGLALPQGYTWTVDKTGAATATATATATVSTTSNNYTNLADTVKTFTPVGSAVPVTMGMQPKAIVEEFDPTWGKMNATLGAELPNTNANIQTTVPFGYAEPATEVLDPHQIGTPIGQLGDGTQIWKITHNGVDSHPVHFHLFDVQLINRVGWDGAKYAAEPGELGWKDTVLMHPLEDTIVALRPQIPSLPFKIPNSVRPIDPAMPLNDPISSFDAKTGQAITVPNTVQDYGWEYVWHCHMLSHEEMDFMRPMIVHGAPAVPTGLTGVAGTTSVALTWTGPTALNPALTNYTLQRATTPDFTTGLTPLADASTTPALTEAKFADSGLTPLTTYYYRVRSESVSGYSPWSDVSTVVTVPAPTGLQVTMVGPNRNRAYTSSTLRWTGAVLTDLPTGTAVTSQVQRSTTATFTGSPATVGGGTTTTFPQNVAAGATTYYRVQFSYTLNGKTVRSAWTTLAVVAAVPSGLAATPVASSLGVRLAWTAPTAGPAPTGYEVQRAADTGFTTPVSSTSTSPSLTDVTVTPGATYAYRVRATYPGAVSLWSSAVTVTVPVPAPTGLAGSVTQQPDGRYAATLSWADAATYGTVQVQRSTDKGKTWTVQPGLAGSSTTWSDSTAIAPGGSVLYQVRGTIGTVLSAWTNALTVTAPSTPQTPALALKAGTAKTTGLGTFTVTITPSGPVTATGYTLTYRTDTGAPVTSTVLPGALPTLVKGLPKTKYTVTVSATSSAGSSPAATLTVTTN